VGAPESIARIGQRVVAAAAPAEANLFGVLGESFYDSATFRRRMVSRVVTGGAREDALAFDAGHGFALVSGVVLVVLNGIACNLVSDLAGGQLERGWTWWRQRRLRLALGGRARDGELTAVPPMSAVEATAVGELTFGIGVGAGLSEEQARQVANLVTGALTPQVVVPRTEPPTEPA
jgi:hypothetical protein